MRINQVLITVVALIRCVLNLSNFCVKQEGQKFIHDEAVLLKLGNTLDRWILSFTQSLVLFVHNEMAGKCITYKVSYNNNNNSTWYALYKSKCVYNLKI